MVLKGLLVITVLALIVLLVFGLVMIAGWSWWVGFFLMLGLVGIGLGFLVFRKFMKRRQEQMFVHQIIAQDESMRQSMSPADQNTAKELQARWKEAIDALRKSHLRKYGNPLYVLPWYMVIGGKRFRQDHRHQECTTFFPVRRGQPYLGHFRHAQLRLVVFRAGHSH